MTLDFEALRKKRGVSTPGSGELDFEAYRNRSVNVSPPVTQQLMPEMSRKQDFLIQDPRQSELARSLRGETVQTPNYNVPKQTEPTAKDKGFSFTDAANGFNAFVDRMKSSATFGLTDIPKRIFSKIGPQESRDMFQGQIDRDKNAKGGVIADVLGSLASGQIAYKAGSSIAAPFIKNAPSAIQSLVRGAAAGAAYEVPRQAVQEIQEPFGGKKQDFSQRLKNVGVSTALGGLTDLGINVGGLASRGIKDPIVSKALGGAIGVGSLGAAMGSANEVQQAMNGQKQSLGGRVKDVAAYTLAGAGLGTLGGSLLGRFMEGRTPVEAPITENPNVGTATAGIKARVQTKPGLNEVLEQMKPLVDERMTPPLENPNELAKWIQGNFKAGGDDISLNEIRKLDYEEMRSLSEEMRKQLTVEESARAVAKDLGYDFDKLLSAKTIPNDLVQRARKTQELQQAYNVSSPINRTGLQTNQPRVETTTQMEPTNVIQQAEPLSIKPSEISGTVGNFGSGITDGMYNSLWSKVQKGITEEAGAPSTMLQVAKAIKDRGGMTSIDELKGVAAEVASAKNRGVTGQEFQRMMNNVVDNYSPNFGTAERQKQNVFTDLFGDQNLGIASRGGRIEGQGPVNTEDSIVRNSIRNDREGIGESVKAQVRSAYQDHVDALDPLKKLGDDVYNTAMDASRANNIANVIVNDKFVDLQGRVIGDSLKDIFTKVAKGQDKKFIDFLNLKRATTRMSRNEKVFDDRLQMTPEKVQERIGNLERTYPGFEQISNDYYKFWDNIRKIGVDEGLISADMKAALETSEPYYVPQMRQFSRSEKPGKEFLARGSKNAFSGQKAPIQRLSEGGSGRPLVDARKSTIEAVGAWTNAVLRNRTLQPVVRALRENPDAFKGIVSEVDNTANVAQSSLGDINAIIEKDGIDGLVEAFNNNFDLVMNKGKNINLDAENVLRVMVDGEPAYLKIEDPEVVKAAIAMGPQATSLLTDVMSAFSNATKRGATGLLAPLFAVKGATMDLASSAIQAKNPMKQAAYTVYSIFSGIGDNLGIPGLRDWAQEYRRMGGGYSYSLKGERNVSKSIDGITRYPTLSGRNAVKTTKNVLSSPFKVLESIGNIAENAPRIAASKIELERLGGELTPENVRRAMNAGREATVNYSRKGLKTSEIEAFAPYSNAAVQGTRRILKAFKDNPVRTAAAVGVLSVLPKLIEYSRFHDDEDYQNIPARERMRNVFVKKNADGSFVKVPLDPAYTSFGEMTIEGLRAFKDSDPSAFKGSMDALVNAWTPPLVTGLLQGLTKGDGVKGSLAGVANATVFGPPSSIISNKSFTGAPVVSKSLEDRSGRYQYDEKTSAVAKKIGEITGFSPVMTDYIIKAYGGDAARIALPLTSELGKGNTRNTLLKNFITDPTFTNTLSDDFYDAKDRLNQAYANFKEAGVKLPSWYDDEIRKLLNSSAKGSISSNLAELRAYKKQISADKTLSNKQQSDKMREVQEKINTLLTTVNSALKERKVIK